MKKTDQITMRDHNQRLVLQALFNAKETSRAQLAVDLELHKSTISSIYRDLDDIGLLKIWVKGIQPKQVAARLK